MRASNNEQTASAGQNEVKARFEKIGWGPVDNPYHDLGTDLYLAVRDERLHDRLLLVGAQVKTGRSWFEKPLVKGGEVAGWWFYEPDKRHFDDWAAHSIPHLIVLHDPRASISYWAHVTPEKIMDTGQGCKIFIPASQTIDENHRDALLEIAASRQKPASWEGTAWTGISNVGPGRVWRHALIAPRLVAPHRNRGFSEPITPAQAAALLVLGRLRDLSNYAEKHDSVLPEPTGADVSSDWELVEALRAALVSDDVSGLRSWLGNATDRPQRAAATLAVAAVLIELEQVDEALGVLQDLVDDDEQSPIDHAWALVQRARARSEIGQIAEARLDADTALRDLLGAEDDVTASAIRSSASWLLFSTAELGEGSLADILTKGDTAVSWWRSQYVSNALSEHFDRFFSAWVADDSTKFAMEDTLTNGITSAMVSAGLLGDQGTWRAYSSLLGRHLVIDRHGEQNDEGLREALDLLRRSGNAKALQQAARRLLNVGPLLPLAQVSVEVGAHSWTHTTAQANLKLWETAGDLLDTTAADTAATLCLDALLDPSHPRIHRTAPRFDLPNALMGALLGLLPATSNALHGAVVAALLPLAASPDLDELLAQSLRRIIEGIRWNLIDPNDQALWLDVARRDLDQRLGPTIMAAVAHGGNDEAVTTVRTKVTGGDIPALLAYNDISILDDASAKVIVDSLKPRIDGIVNNAREGRWSMYEWSAPEVAASLSLRFPEAACWPELLDLLFEPACSEEDKAGVCDRLASGAVTVPPRVVGEIKDNLPRLRVGQRDWLSPGSSGLDGLVDRLAFKLGLMDESAVARLLARGATSANDGDRRQTALMLAGMVGTDVSAGTLAGLANDSTFSVRRAAATATAQRVRAGDRSALILELLAHFLDAPGRTLPMTAARNLMSADPLHPPVQSMVAPLRTHPSAIVRAVHHALTDASRPPGRP